MKSYHILLLAFLSFVCINLNGQVFVGGNFGINSSTSKNEDGTSTLQKSSSHNFGFAPMVGKFQSEKLAIGISLNLAFSGNSSESNGVNNPTSTTASTIGISPFIRYYAFKWNKFSLYGQGNAGIDFSNYSSKNGGVTTQGPKDTRFYVTFLPGLSYDVNDKLSFQTSLNILSLNYAYLSSKDGSITGKSSSFNFGGGLGNIVSVSSITIGAIYKF